MDTWYQLGTLNEKPDGQADGEEVLISPWLMVNRADVGEACETMCVPTGGSFSLNSAIFLAHEDL